MASASKQLAGICIQKMDSWQGSVFRGRTGFTQVVENWKSCGIEVRISRPGKVMEFFKCMSEVM